MKDQAEQLRVRIQQLSHNRNGKTIAVISGKGGVGKSNFSLNFALSLSRLGKKILLFDMDIGMGNIDILLGTSSPYTFVDMFDRGMMIHDVINKGPENLTYIAGGSGLSKLFSLDQDKLNEFLHQLQNVIDQYDFVLFDMGAGMSRENVNLLKSMNEIIVITTPEPTAITDAYAAMKLLTIEKSDLPFSIVINRASNEKEGRFIFKRVHSALSQFLQKESTLLGVIPEDQTVVKAVNRQTPIVLFDPKSKAALAIKKMAEQFITSSSHNQNLETRSLSFIARLRQYFLER
jgi:flagellar biosynthesis protein FlhG